MQQIQEIIEKSTSHRGWIANSFAQIEFLLGDLIVRCREFPAYEKFTRNVSHSASERVKKLRSMIDCPGPLDLFAPELREILDTFADKQGVRNLLAHGYCEVEFTNVNDVWFVFRKFDRDKAANDALIFQRFTLADLDQHRADLHQLAQKTVTLFDNIRGAFAWENGSAAMPERPPF